MFIIDTITDAPISPSLPTSTQPLPLVPLANTTLLSVSVDPACGLSG